MILIAASRFALLVLLFRLCTFWLNRVSPSVSGFVISFLFNLLFVSFCSLCLLGEGWGDRGEVRRMSRECFVWQKGRGDSDRDGKSSSTLSSSTT